MRSGWFSFFLSVCVGKLFWDINEYHRRSKRERKERRALKSLSFVRDSCEEEVEGNEMESSKENGVGGG